jgi:hypothetical protein
VDQFLNSLPKTVLAIGVMIVGLFLIRQLQPPRTICDTQLESFRETQKTFLYSTTTLSGITKLSEVKRLTELCKQDNSPGGCFELFLGLRKMTADLKNIPDQCAEAAAGEKAITNWVWSSMKLMVQMAWGDRAPASYIQKNGWYDTSELTLFCNLKNQALRLYGQDEFKRWQQQALTDLPKADELGWDQVWQRNILSTPCELYR